MGLSCPRVLERVFEQHLEGKDSVEADVLYSIHRTKPAAPDALEDAIAFADDLADERVGGGGGACFQWALRDP